ncbi:MAG TPA: ATP-binding protein, partial [Anaeromyxobacteraceae bacterium]|nr:ATP-binding protein [Anaeromyxobacteraceae bacterium]
RGRSLPPFRSQRTKAVALLSAPLALLLLGLGLWLPVSIRDRARALFEDRARDLTRVAAAAVGPAVELDDATGAALVLDALGASQGIAYDVVLRPDGRVLVGEDDEAGDARLDASGAGDSTWYRDDLFHVRATVPLRSGAHGTLLVAFRLGELEAVQRQAVHDVALACLAALAVGLVGAFALGTLLVRPLRRMASVADRVAAGEAAAALELEVNAPDETGALSRALARMLSRLYEEQATVEHLNAGLEARVVERTAELAQANGELADRLAQLKRTQEQLIVSDRRVSIGRLAAGVAHEINNPLAFIEANLRFAAEELPAVATWPRRPPAEARDAERLVAELGEAIAESRQGAERVRHIVRGLKTFARSDEDQRAPVEVREALEAAIDMSAHELRQRAELVRDLSPVPRIEGNAVRLSQVFLNLLVNAVQAIPEGAPDGRVRVVLGTDARGWAVAEVHDNGCGIAPELLPRIFDPFFTTKPVGEGTGLGLSISQGIVLSLGGEIGVESEPGRGTTFRVALPPCPGEAPPERRAAAEAAGGARRKVLVVDDEPLVASAVRRALARQHEVVVAHSGPEALARVLGGDRFDHILCDLMMPGMTGAEFRDALVRADAGQAARVVFMTGGAFTDATRAFLASHPGPCLEKPLDLDAVRRFLDARA